MQPTNELRFVERREQYCDRYNVITFRMIPVLQQKWTEEHRGYTDEEWRDVPLVKESNHE